MVVIWVHLCLSITAAMLGHKSPLKPKGFEVHVVGQEAQMFAAVIMCPCNKAALGLIHTGTYFNL